MHAHTKHSFIFPTQHYLCQFHSTEEVAEVMSWFCLPGTEDNIDDMRAYVSELMTALPIDGLAVDEVCTS